MTEIKTALSVPGDENSKHQSLKESDGWSRLWKENYGIRLVLSKAVHSQFSSAFSPIPRIVTFSVCVCVHMPVCEIHPLPHAPQGI